MIGIYCHHTSRFSRNTGIQRCLRATAKALVDQGHELVPLVWNRASNGLALASPEARAHLAGWGGPPAAAWRLQPLPAGSWLLVVELISGPHQPDQAWLRRLADRHHWRLAAVFHDAIPLGWGGAAARHHSHYMQGLADYDLVLSVSATSRAALERFWQRLAVPIRARLQTLPLAAQIPGKLRELPDQTPLPPLRPLRLLCVGSLEPRKNHRRLLQALAWLNAQGRLRARLQLVGWANDPGVVSMVRRAQALALPLEWDGEASDDALLAAYRRCDLTVYPSLQEGYGLPVQESLWMGRPCLTGRAPALLEQAAGGGCWSVDSSSWQPLAAAIERLQRDPQLLQALRAQIARRPLRSWNHYAHEMLLLMAATDLDRS